MSGRTLGYVVVEWNQMNKQGAFDPPDIVLPPIVWPTLHEAWEQEKQTRGIGRPGTTTVAAVVEVNDNE